MFVLHNHWLFTMLTLQVLVTLAIGAAVVAANPYIFGDIMPFSNFTDSVVPGWNVALQPTFSRRLRQPARSAVPSQSQLDRRSLRLRHTRGMTEDLAHVKDRPRVAILMQFSYLKRAPH